MPQFEARTPTWTTRYPLAVNWWLLPGTHGGGRRCGQRRSWRRRSRPVEIPIENTAASIREPMRHGSCRDGFNFRAMSIKGDETPGPGWPGPELFDECLRRDLADDELVIRPGIEQNPPGRESDRLVCEPNFNLHPPLFRSFTHHDHACAAARGGSPPEPGGRIKLRPRPLNTRLEHPTRSCQTRPGPVAVRQRARRNLLFPRSPPTVARRRPSETCRRWGDAGNFKIATAISFAKTGSLKNAAAPARCGG